MIALLIVALGVIAFFIARARANIFDAGSLAGRAAVARPHSRPVYHGAFVALAAVIPSLLRRRPAEVADRPRRHRRRG
jgi:phosphate transport system permease protein